MEGQMAEGRACSATRANFEKDMTEWAGGRGCTLMQRWWRQEVAGTSAGSIRGSRLKDAAAAAAGYWVT